MKKVLVLGGTRYFGRHLVEDLLAKNYDVTVASRGNIKTPFSKEVQFLHCDRKSAEELKKLAEAGPFDIIYDQICMSGIDAQIAIEAFRDTCGKYVFTSTGSVYDFKNDHLLIEGDFNPKDYPLNLMPTNSYQENKRQAEVVMSLQKYFPATMVRFPIVLGKDDYTERLKFHVQRIAEGREIYFSRPETKLAFISSFEAGKFLSFIGEHEFSGPVNAVSDGIISLSELSFQIEKITGERLKRASRETAENSSPFGSDTDFVLGNALAKSLGFQFENLQDFLPGLIKFYFHEF